jgi:hypothetical protein
VWVLLMGIGLGLALMWVRSSRQRKQLQGKETLPPVEGPNVVPFRDRNR